MISGIPKITAVAKNIEYGVSSDTYSCINKEDFRFSTQIDKS